jgi:hypothetical protein
MSSGMPLESNDPVGVVYLIWVSDEDGRNETCNTVILGKSEAEKYVGSDSRMKATPMLTFATAKAAKAYNTGEARKKVLGKLTEVEQMILLGRAE